METEVQIPKTADASNQKNPNSTEFPFCLLSFKKEITARGHYKRIKYVKKLSRSKGVCPSSHYTNTD